MWRKFSNSIPSCTKTFQSQIFVNSLSSLLLYTHNFCIVLVKVFDCLLVVMKAARKYTTKDNCDVLCDCLISQIESSITNKEDEDAEGNTLSHGVDGLKISYLIKLVTCLVEWKSGLLVGKCGTNIWKVINCIVFHHSISK